MDKKQLEESLVLYFSNYENVKLVLVFGSYAKDSYTANSDVDVAIYVEEKNEEKRFELFLKIRRDLEVLLKKEIDLIDLFKTNGLLLCQIMKNNLRIKYNSVIYTYLLTKSIGFNEDFLPLVRLNRSVKIRRALHG